MARQKKQDNAPGLIGAPTDAGGKKRISDVYDEEVTASDGKIYKTQFYNLDAIISVGYRVKWR